MGYEQGAKGMGGCSGRMERGSHGPGPSGDSGGLVDSGGSGRSGRSKGRQPFLSLLLALLRALPKALRTYRLERRGRLRLLDMDERMLADLGFTRAEAEAQVRQVRLWPLWKSLAQGRPRKSACRRGCPVPPTVFPPRAMDPGCHGRG